MRLSPENVLLELPTLERLAKLIWFRCVQLGYQPALDYSREAQQLSLPGPALSVCFTTVLFFSRPCGQPVVSHTFNDLLYLSCLASTIQTP